MRRSGALGAWVDIKDYRLSLPQQAYTPKVAGPKHWHLEISPVFSYSNLLMWVKNISLTAFSILTGLMLCEGVSRILFDDWKSYNAERFMSLQFVPGFGKVTVGQAHFNGAFAQNDGDFNVNITINRSGFRETKPMSDADDAIWFVGDSFTFGWGVEQPERFSDFTGKLLGKKTYNIASPGTDICGYQAQIARVLKKTSPEAVVVGLFIENDVKKYHCPRGNGPGRQPENHTFLVTLPSFSITSIKQALIKYSALYNVIVPRIKQSTTLVNFLIDVGIVARPHAEFFRAALVTEEILAGTIDEVIHIKSMIPNDASLIVLIIPTRRELQEDNLEERFLRRKIINMLEKQNIQVADPFAQLKKKGFGNVHFSHDGHWTPLGHSIAAYSIKDLLAERD